MNSGSQVWHQRKCCLEKPRKVPLKDAWDCSSLRARAVGEHRCPSPDDLLLSFWAASRTKLPASRGCPGCIQKFSPRLVAVRRGWGNFHPRTGPPPGDGGFRQASSSGYRRASVHRARETRRCRHRSSTKCEREHARTEIPGRFFLASLSKDWVRAQGHHSPNPGPPLRKERREEQTTAWVAVAAADADPSSGPRDNAIPERG